MMSNKTLMTLKYFESDSGVKNVVDANHDSNAKDVNNIKDVKDSLKEVKYVARVITVF